MLTQRSRFPSKSRLRRSKFIDFGTFGKKLEVKDVLHHDAYDVKANINKCDKDPTRACFYLASPHELPEPAAQPRAERSTGFTQSGKKQGVTDVLQHGDYAAKAKILFGVIRSPQFKYPGFKSVLHTPYKTFLATL